MARRLKQRYGVKINPADRPFLPGYGDEQGEIARELAGFVKEVVDTTDNLPKEKDKLKQDALQFLLALDQSGASNHMGQAVSASRNTDAPRTYREAQLAYEKLMSLIQPGGCSNCFTGMCRGQQPDFGPEDMKKTLQEMFRSLCRKRGVGEGQGTGSGPGGANANGSSNGADGYSELGTPVYGPNRSSMGKAVDGKGQTGKGQGTEGAGAGHGPDVVERLPGADSMAPAGEAIQFERLPMKYRDEVKRYFQIDREGGDK